MTTPTIFPRLHRDLKIPDGYYRTDLYASRNIGQRQYEPAPPAITDDERASAVAALQSAGVIAEQTTEGLLRAITDSLSRLAGDGPAKPRQPIVNKKPEIVDAIMANPYAPTRDICDRTGFAARTINRYRQELKDDGRI